MSLVLQKFDTGIYVISHCLHWALRISDSTEKFLLRCEVVNFVIIHFWHRYQNDLFYGKLHCPTKSILCSKIIDNLGNSRCLC